MVTVFTLATNIKNIVEDKTKLQRTHLSQYRGDYFGK
jgi:hypothetical protein